MNIEQSASEKIRFNRDEIIDLGALPSSAPPQMRVRVRRWRGRSHLRRAASATMLVAGLLAIVLLLVMQFGIPTIGTERLRAQAERTASRFAGVPIEAALGPMDISFTSGRLLALQVSDVRMAAASTGGPEITAGDVSFGLRLLPLLAGRLQLGNASLTDGRIVAGALTSTGERDWAANLKNEEGLFDPDRVLAAVFEGLHRAFNGLDAGQTRSLLLENVEVVLPGEETRFFMVRSASLTRHGENLAFDAELDINGRVLQIEGDAVRPSTGGTISQLSLAMDSGPRQVNEPIIEDGETTVDPSLGTLTMDLIGSEGSGEEPNEFTAALSMSDAAIDFGRSGVIEGTAELALELIEGSGELAINRARVESGDTVLAFRGSLGPQPAADAPASPPAYRFEIVSDGSRLAAAGLAEPALDIRTTLAGSYSPDRSRLSFDQFSIETADGGMTGSGALQFDGRRAPGIEAELTTTAMPVGSAKQIWPFVVAPGARSWVLGHVSGGRVAESSITLAIPPGRLGDGIPFLHHEAHGRFVIENTGFTIRPTMPPVRDANGVISFAGNDVEVKLASGTGVLAEERTVSVSNGTLRIPGGQVDGIIGELRLDLAGDARSVTEVAASEPIDAMRHVGAAPEDFSGDIWGTVEASIPLSDDVERSRLKWKVDLAFDQLSLAQPLSGQEIKDASGTAVIDQTRAKIFAKAQLSGIPADLEITEPVGSSGETFRKRLIDLELDDKTRKALFPALDPLVSGTMVLQVDATDADKQTVTADLTRTGVHLPWLGWSKGSGVPADLSFTMSANEGVTLLDDFRLAGASFVMAGDIRLSDGGLASASFETVKLNRDDEVAVSLQRQGDGYRVRARGSAFDARALVKQYLADSASVEVASGADALPVTIDATVDRATGFNGETVSNLKVSYVDGGLRVSGVLGSGGGVALSTASGPNKSVQLQSTDAGALLRFADIYQYMQGGRIEMALAGQGDAPLTGAVSAVNFRIVDEPKLRSLVSSAPPQGRSLNEQLRNEIDASSVTFERGFTRVEKGPGTLKLSQGVVRGPTIGASFQGTFYDQAGNMDMTGTFMPAYGVNRIFGEIPVIGQILGNGRDRGLIGITFRLAGSAKAPELQVNPISAIAPGIFRSIFEF